MNDADYPYHEKRNELFKLLSQQQTELVRRVIAILRKDPEWKWVCAYPSTARPGEITFSDGNENMRAINVPEEALQIVNRYGGFDDMAEAIRLGSARRTGPGTPILAPMGCDPEAPPLAVPPDLCEIRISEYNNPLEIHPPPTGENKMPGEDQIEVNVTMVIEDVTGRLHKIAGYECAMCERIVETNMFRYRSRDIAIDVTNEEACSMAAQPDELVKIIVERFEAAGHVEPATEDTGDQNPPPDGEGAAPAEPDEPATETQSADPATQAYDHGFKAGQADEPATPPHFDDPAMTAAWFTGYYAACPVGAVKRVAVEAINGVLRITEPHECFAAMRQYLIEARNVTPKPDPSGDDDNAEEIALNEAVDAVDEARED